MSRSNVHEVKKNIIEKIYNRFGFELVQSRFEKISVSLNLEPNIAIKARPELEPELNFSSVQKV